MKRNLRQAASLILLLQSLVVFAQEVQPVRPGLEHVRVKRFTKNAEAVEEPLVINLLKVDLNIFRVQIRHALDEAIVLETVSSMVARHNALAGVNAGFFAISGTYRGDNVGALVSNGIVLSEPTNNRAAIGLVRQGETTEMIFGHLRFEGTLQTARGLQHPVQGINRARSQDELIIYTPEFHRTTLTTPDGLEVEVRRGVVSRHLDRSGSNQIPTDGYIISVTGKAREWAAKNLRVGARVNFRTRFIPAESGTAAKWERAFSIVAGGPQLIRGGRREITSEFEGIRQAFVSDRHPRTAVAKLRDGRMMLAVIDGRQAGYSVGVSLTEFADLLLEFGAIEAINLDGGGSTAMVVEGKLVNQPSDATGERAVSDAMLIFEKAAGRQK